MADLLSLPSRITKSNGDPAPGALLTVFDQGTTTPRAAFQDSSLATPHDSPIQASEAGVPPQIFTSGATGVKVVITDRDGAALFTYDPIGRQTLDASDADGINITPTAYNPATDVETAVDNATKLVAVSADDTTPGNLEDKLTVAAPLTLTEVNPGTNENLRIGLAVLDEDDLATDSATQPASQQSIKAYVDNLTANTKWTYSAVNTTTGGTNIDFGSLPAGLIDIELYGTGISLTGTDDFLVQLGASGTPQATGYAASAQFPTSSNNVAGATSAAGAIIQGNSGTPLANLFARCARYPGTNEWVISHTMNTTGLYVGSGLASVTLSGALDILRLTVTGSDTFDGNNTFVRYR